MKLNILIVIPAKAGIQSYVNKSWIPDQVGDDTKRESPKFLGNKKEAVGLFLKKYQSTAFAFKEHYLRAIGSSL